jgi:hypothetical protein
MGSIATKTSMRVECESSGLSDSLSSLAFPSPRRWIRKERSTAETLKRASVDHPRSGGIQVQVRWGVLSCFGLLEAPGASGPRRGPRAAAVFPRPTLIPEFA